MQIYCSCEYFAIPARLEFSPNKGHLSQNDGQGNGRRCITMHRRFLTLGILAACALLFWGDQARGGFRHVGTDGNGNGPYINLIMREVRVTPIHAHVGDVIRADMVIENRGDLGNDTAKIELLANGKAVASQLYNYGFTGEGGRIYRATFHWDTKGVKPGEYKVRGEVFVWYDASPFDNFLDVN